MALADLGIGAAIRQGQAGTIDNIAKAVDERLPKPDQRQCLIQFQNHTAGHDLVKPEITVYQGTVYSAPLPNNVGVSMETTVLYLKSDTKTTGTLVYHLEASANGGDVKRFFLIFGVPHGGGIPHDENENWFSINLSQAPEVRSLKMASDGDDQRSRGGQSLTLIKEGFRVEATMTDAKEPNIVVKIYDEEVLK